MPARTKSANSEATANTDLEAKLWAAADALHILEPSSHNSGPPGICGDNLMRLNG